MSTTEYKPCGWRAWLNNTTITLGVNNVMDLAPPSVARAFENSYDESIATIKGPVLVRRIKEAILNCKIIWELHLFFSVGTNGIIMFMKPLKMGFVGLVLSVATAWAGPSAIQGVVKDAKGQAIKGADVQIQSRDGKKLFQTVKTDRNGHYVSNGLAAGVYRVTLVVNGGVKASITNTQTKADQRTQLNFDLKPASASQASAPAKKGKHMVWVPSNTGSHIGGRWVEVDENGSADSGALNVKRGSAEALRQQQLQNSPGGLPTTAVGGGGGTP